jgi:hypothetical protein
MLGQEARCSMAVHECTYRLSAVVGGERKGPRRVCEVPAKLDGFLLSGKARYFRAGGRDGQEPGGETGSPAHVLEILMDQGNLWLATCQTRANLFSPTQVVSDKVLGQSVLSHRKPEACGQFVSVRVQFETSSTAARADIRARLIHERRVQDSPDQRKVMPATTIYAADQESIFQKILNVGCARAADVLASFR